jgi:hypothetical protein
MAGIATLTITASCVSESEEPETGTADSAIVSPLPEDFAIVVPGSGGCVDVANYSLSNGGPIHQWSCHYDANQLWRFTAVGQPGESVYAITSRWSGLALDVTNVSTAVGAPIQQWGYGGGANQKFRVLYARGKFQLQATHSGQCVSVTRTDTAADFANGALFRQYPCDASDWRQLFQINRRGTLTQKALVVLLQNGGYRNGLPVDPGFDVPTGLTFSCGGWSIDLGPGASVFDAIAAVGVPPFNRCLNPANWSVTTRTRHYTAGEFLREVTNFVAEEAGITTIDASGARARYTTVRILQDSELQLPRIRQELQSLASSYLIDVHVLAHGGPGSFGLDGEVTADGLRDLRTIVGLTLRSVFQQNCYGRTLNSAWLDAGAQVVTGTVGINYMPAAYGPFLFRWVHGEMFGDAVRHSYDDVAPMHRAAYRFLDLYDDADQERHPPQFDVGGGLSPDEELDSSRQIIQGAAGLTL